MLLGLATFLLKCCSKGPALVARLREMTSPVALSEASNTVESSSGGCFAKLLHVAHPTYREKTVHLLAGNKKNHLMGM